MGIVFVAICILCAVHQVGMIVALVTKKFPWNPETPMQEAASIATSMISQLICGFLWQVLRQDSTGSSIMLNLGFLCAISPLLYTFTMAFTGIMRRLRA